MGIIVKGCYLRIINASVRHSLTLSNIHSNSIVNGWNFPSEIKAGTCSTVYMEVRFDDNKRTGVGRCKNKMARENHEKYNDDNINAVCGHIDNNYGVCAKASYSIGDTGCVFSIQVKRCCQKKVKDGILLHIDWSNISRCRNEEEFFLLPPSTPFSSLTSFPLKTNNVVVDIGWKCNGTAIMAFSSSFTETTKSNLLMETKMTMESKKSAVAQSLVSPSHNDKNGSENNSSNETTQLNPAFQTTNYPQQHRSFSLLSRLRSMFISKPSSSSLPPLIPCTYTNWMERYGSQIKHLPLTKLCLIETHNAATKNMKTAVSSPWASTQKTSILQQLCGGVRVLDLRIGCFVENDNEDNDGSSSKNDWPLVHDKWLTTTTLGGALSSVCQFVTRYTKEVIILDFHRFITLPTKKCTKHKKNNTKRNYVDLNNMIQFVTTQLGELLYNNPGYIPTLEEIWNDSLSFSGGGRVIVAWNSTHPSHDPFFQGVRHGWYQHVTNKDELKIAIDRHLSSEKKKSCNYPNNNERLWTVGAVIPALVFTPLYPITELKEWFIPGKEWMNHVNILQTDFSIEIDIVESAVSQCLINAASVIMNAQGVTE